MEFYAVLRVNITPPEFVTGEDQRALFSTRAGADKLWKQQHEVYPNRGLVVVVINDISE